MHSPLEGERSGGTKAPPYGDFLKLSALFIDGGNSL